MKIIISYISTLITFIFLDAIWLGLVAKGFYAKQMGFLFSKSINFIPVLVFYPVYAFGVMILAVLPAFSSGSWLEALWKGALIGLLAYGAYDLTNQATIAGWPTLVTVIDIGWGIVVTGATSVIAYFLINLFY
jgi:uncharacterized membrane protein